jgi:hypothetical protein
MIEKPPINPYLILFSSLILPGSGHVWLGLAQRGLLFLFFIVILGWASANMMPAHFSFIGKHIGGIFVYGISVLDAYKVARIRITEWKHARTTHPHL